MSEQVFWHSTIGEIERYMASYSRRKKAELKEKATFDYILADLIGASSARMMSKKAKLPKITEVYKELFAEDVKQEEENMRNELTKQRFMLFAKSFNKKYEKEVLSE